MSDATGPEEKLPEKCCFSFTFSGCDLNTCLISRNSECLNKLEADLEKRSPTAFPEEKSECITEIVRNGKGQDDTSNIARSWEGWEYITKVYIPAETEEGNMYDSFALINSVSEDLIVEEVRLLCDGKDDCDSFDITVNGNLVRAEGKNLHSAEFYNHEYSLEICVKTETSKASMVEDKRLDDDFAVMIKNCSVGEYRDENGTATVNSNETETRVCYEKEGDIVLTEKVHTQDLYPEHDRATFLFNIRGETVTGEEKEYNRQITIEPKDIKKNSDSQGYITKTVTIKNVPGGSYTCSEYDLLRFKTEDITDISVGEKKGNTVLFIIDSAKAHRAIFLSGKNSWGNYSDSNIAVSRIGLN